MQNNFSLGQLKCWFGSALFIISGSRRILFLEESMTLCEAPEKEDFTAMFIIPTTYHIYLSLDYSLAN